MSTAIERILAERGEKPRETETKAKPPRPPREFPLGVPLAVAGVALAVWAFAHALTGTVTEIAIVRGLVTLSWALAAVVLVRHEQSQHLGLLATAGAALGAAAGLWTTIRPIAAGLLPAAGMHLLLAYPDGLRTTARKGLAALAASFARSSGQARTVLASQPSATCLLPGAPDSM